jgi:hypothetical protein
VFVGKLELAFKAVERTAALASQFVAITVSLLPRSEYFTLYDYDTKTGILVNQRFKG